MLEVISKDLWILNSWSYNVHNIGHVITHQSVLFKEIKVEDGYKRKDASIIGKKNWIQKYKSLIFTRLKNSKKGWSLNYKKIFQSNISEYFCW